MTDRGFKAMIHLGAAVNLSINLNSPQNQAWQPQETSMLEYEVSARRIDEHGGLAVCKDAQITLDTAIAGRRDAFNPAELFLASIAACMIKGIERVTPMLKFELRGVAVQLKAVRRDAPPMIISVTYELTVDSDESDQRLELLHTNVRKYGTISNTVAEATKLQGVIKRMT